jgi:dynein heavy chain
MIKDCTDAIDPALDTLVVRRIFTSDGKTLVKFLDFHIDEKFRLYLVTKLENPRVPQAVFVRATVVYFVPPTRVACIALFAAERRYARKWRRP